MPLARLARVFLPIIVCALSLGAGPSGPGHTMTLLAREAEGPATPAFGEFARGFAEGPAAPNPFARGFAVGPAASNQFAGAQATAQNWEWRDGLLQPREASTSPVVERLPPVDLPGGALAARDDLTLDYYDPFTRQLSFGNAGFQPYRLGWYFYDDFTYFPTSPVRGVSGSFQDLQWNSWTRYARVVADRYLFTWTGSWNSSFWTGPSGVNLPADADQLASDFQIASLNPGRWNWQVGVTPQVNADFRKSLDSNAYMVDGRFVVFYQASSQLRLAAGAAYWNRVRDFFIPYGGLIWSPDNRWEFRMFFPQSRISRYWGTIGHKHVWTYASAGYNVDAWQVTIQNIVPEKTRMQMSDIQALLGVSTQSGRWTAFAEGGIVFDRHVLFRGNTPSFGIHDNLLLRIGALY